MQHAHASVFDFTQISVLAARAHAVQRSKPAAREFERQQYRISERKKKLIEVV
jgi:hypothetical protein